MIDACLELLLCQQVLGIALELVNVLCRGETRTLESLCVVGLAPVVFSYASAAYPTAVRHQSALFMHQMCFASMRTVELFVACQVRLAPFCESTSLVSHVDWIDGWSRDPSICCWFFYCCVFSSELQVLVPELQSAFQMGGLSFDERHHLLRSLEWREFSLGPVALPMD